MSLPSIQIVQDDLEAGDDQDCPRSSLVFEYDAREPLIASIYLGVKETKSILHEVTTKLEPCNQYFAKGMHFELPPGQNQLFPRGWVSASDELWEKFQLIKKDQIEGLGNNQENRNTVSYYDLVIRLQEKSAKAKREHALLYVYGTVNLGKTGMGSKPATSRIDPANKPTSRTTDFVSVTASEQKVELNGMAFKLGQIYNLAGGVEENPCLICLNEPANLVLQPCGHLALGDLCIKTYFEKNDNRMCPLCRASVKELISVKDSGIDYEKATEARLELENKDGASQLGPKRSVVFDFRMGKAPKPLGIDSVVESFGLGALSRGDMPDSPHFRTLTHHDFMNLNREGPNIPEGPSAPGRNYNPATVRPAQVPQLDLDLASHQEIDLDTSEINKEDPDGLHNHPSGRQFAAAMPKLTSRDIQLFLQRSKERLPPVHKDFRMTYDERDTKRSREKTGRLAETQKSSGPGVFSSFDASKLDKF